MMNKTLRWDVLGLGIAVLWLLFWYEQTAMSMVSIWLRSDTFAHGIIVPVISAWLIWRDRHWILSHESKPSFSALLLVIVASAAWFMSQLANANSPSQFALVSILVAIFPVLTGWRMARRLLFPLLFLFFSVPMGEFFLPILMEKTADFTVAALRLSAIPVYREGQFLIIPSGSWSVVEACSGIRYLIASLMVGTLYSYLNYKAWSRKISFIVISGLVPLLANWVRAYLIVLMGHLSDNTIAVGVDHLIYGWIFFGLVMALMFWIGSFWHEHNPRFDVQPIDNAMTAALPVRKSYYMIWLILMTILAAPHFVMQSLQQVELHAKKEVSNVYLLEPELPGWLSQSGTLTTWKPLFHNPSTELYRVYQQDEQRFGVYVGYYRNQTAANKLISSDNVLVPSSRSAWMRTGGGLVSDSPGLPTNLVVDDLFNMALDQRIVIWRWYWISGFVTSNELLGKAYTAIARVLGQKDDSAVVMVYGFKDRTNEQALAAFVAQINPAIEQMLIKTREQP